MNGDDEVDIGLILLGEKAKSLAKMLSVDNYTASNTSDHVPVHIILNIKAACKILFDLILYVPSTIFQ